MPSPATRPRLLLHIGAHKTGTTAIQKALHEGRSALAARGLLYADTRRPPWPELPKHTSVFHAAALGDEDEQARERALLWDEFERSGAHTLVLSEEGLSEALPRLPGFFAPWRERFDITVLCFVRRQDLFVESLYSQFVREPARRETRSLLAFSRAPAVRERMDFAAVLAPWQAQLEARLVVRDFDAARQGAGLVASFVEAAGWRDLSLPETLANPSPDMRLVLALRRLNVARQDLALPVLMRASARLLREQRFAPLRHLLGADERRRLLEAMAPANERLARDHGIRFASALPAGEPAAALEDVEPAYLLELLAQVSLAAGEH